MKQKKIIDAIEFPRADPAELAAFDEGTKRCTMNCGPHAKDPRSAKERKLLCDDCDSVQRGATAVGLDGRMDRMGDVLAKINGQMNEGRCPQSGCIGECAAIDETMPGVWWAALYIWDDDFNDSSRVAKWFHDAGAEDVFVTHVLYDGANGDRDGRTFDGARAWHVQFSMSQN